MHHGDQLGARVQQLFVFIEQQFAALVDGRDAQDGLFFLAQNLPGHDVGVVLHGGDDDFVAGLDMSAAIGVGDQVDALGDAADEDDLAPVGGIEEALDLDAGLFVMAGGTLAQLMHAAMDVGIIRLVELVHGVENALRLLGGGGVIEIDQRFAVDALVQHGELQARIARVDAGFGASCGAPWSFSSNSFSNWSRSEATLMRSTMSRAKA